MTHGTWTLTVAPARKTLFGDAASVLDLLQHPDTLVQENDRGTVSFRRMGGAVLVVKRSKTQERRRWIQLTSIYRGGDGSRAFRNMLRLLEAGLPVPEPVLTLEQSRWGFVVASWHADRHVEGRACTCDDVESDTKGLDILVHMSRAEGMPGAVRMAMLAGVPVVAVNTHGTLEAPGSCGLTVDLDDDRAAADVIEHLVRDAAFRTRLASDASTDARARFDIGMIVAGTVKVYEVALGGAIGCRQIQS